MTGEDPLGGRPLAGSPAMDAGQPPPWPAAAGALTVGEGDVLVVFHPQLLSAHARDMVKLDVMQATGLSGERVLVLDAGMGLAVLRPS